MTSGVRMFIICVQDQAYYLYQLLCMRQLGARVGFSCKTKARGVIKDVIYLLLWGGRWTGLIESKYGLFHVALQLWRAYMYPGFITIFDFSLSIYAKTGCRWRGRKSKNNSFQPFWGCAKAVLSHFILANWSIADSDINTFLWYRKLTDKSERCFLVVCPS